MANNYYIMLSHFFLNKYFLSLPIEAVVSASNGALEESVF